MTRSTEKAMRMLPRMVAAGLLALGPGALAAQDGQFDLRSRASPPPPPEPTVAGPLDPETPAVRPGPSDTPTIVPPSPNALPRPSATARPPVAASPAPESGRVRPIAGSAAKTAPTPLAEAPLVEAPPIEAPPAEAPLAADNAAQPPPRPLSATPSAAVIPPAPPPGTYQPRNLEAMARPGGIGRWLGLAALALLIFGGGWLAWSRHLRHRPRAVSPTAGRASARLPPPPAPRPPMRRPGPFRSRPTPG